MDNIILVLFLVFLLGLIALDIGLIVSLVRPGDERKQMVVWKASTWTLLGTSGSLMISIIENMIRGEAVMVNPFVHLGTTAIIYFACLVYYKRKYGG